jgi:RNA polymerase sigma-70 factor (ECF subfamily)
MIRPLENLDEQVLVMRAQQRDEDAFAELVHRNAPTSLRLAVSVLKDRQEAEDQVQTSFMKAWNGLANFQLEARFSTWFRRIVLNQSLMRLRKVKRSKLQSIDQPVEESDRPAELASPALDPEAELGQNQLHARLRREVRRLPQLLREVLELRDFHELSTEETAIQLGITEAATKSRLSRARALLRERMERHVSSSHFATL